MSNNYNNIDDLLRESFDDFSSAPSPEVRAKVSAKVKMFNFLRFNPSSFNIFYTLALVIGTSVIVTLSTGFFSTGTDEVIKPINIVTPEVGIKTTEEINTSNSENTIETSNTNKAIVQNTGVKNEVVRNQGSAQNNNSVVFTESTEAIFENSDDDSIKTSSNIIAGEITEEKIVVYDTVVNNVHITVTDTVKTEIHKTVEVRKNKNNKK
jgi:hypothetical protein